MLDLWLEGRGRRFGVEECGGQLGLMKDTSVTRQVQQAAGSTQTNITLQDAQKLLFVTAETNNVKEIEGKTLILLTYLVSRSGRGWSGRGFGLWVVERKVELQCSRGG